MRFALLGPVEVRDGNDLIPLGRGHERIVLAILLLNADRHTSSARLVDALWADPPSSARGRLHNVISQLRARFHAAGEDLIVAEQADTNCGSVRTSFDLRTFRTLMEQDKQPRAARHDYALAAFEAALALWRGPVLLIRPTRWRRNRACRSTKNGWPPWKHDWRPNSRCACTTSCWRSSRRWLSTTHTGNGCTSSG